MQNTKERTKAEIVELVQKFRRDKNRQQSEADVRAGYIDLLFASLGWNVYNDPGQRTSYRREGYIRGAGFVDVGLEIAGQPTLFLEAKRFGLIPETSKRTGDRTPEEKQAFRYTRGRKIQYAILTNFERLQLFNADHERLIGAFDSPEEYLERFEELWRLTPEEVSGGSLGWWEGQLEKKDVDLEFLKWLRAWRLTLADAIYKGNASNPELQRDGAFDFDKLMGAVQRILARLILIRYGDDKEVLLAHDLLENILDDYRKRGAYASKDYLMRAFVEISHMMDDHHNTTLFAKDHPCEKVIIPNEVLTTVLEDLSRISFRKFTSDILGNTYESYLGTKLKLVNGQIQDEERTDIRKGQGIFYTPTWVVDYIVDKTLGERLKELEKEHGLRAIEKVRGLSVLDPACGSGSFLIRAYRELAEFYQRMNKAIIDEQERLAHGFASSDMFERLERLSHLPQPVPDYPQVILQEHLYGVDLDPEAAEIATVNLTMQGFADSRQKKLPKILNENIKVGNSLISGTEEELKPYFGEAWAEKRRFNWEQEFPAVMERGGFDVVMSNPPYIAYYSRESKAIEPGYRNYMFHAFSDQIGGSQNAFLQFIVQGLRLLKEGGAISYITPDTLMVNERYEVVRRKLITEAILLSIVQSTFAVFDQFVRSCIFVAKKGITDDHVCSLRFAHTLEELKTNRFSQEFLMSQQDLLTNPYCRFLPKIPILSQIRGTTSLSEICQVKDGINPGMSRFGLRNRLFLDHQAGHKPKKLIEGKNISRYRLEWSGKWVDYDENLITPEAKKGGASLRDESIFLQPKKIVSRQTADRLIFALDDQQFCTTNSVHNTFVVASSSYTLEYVLGILNSKFMSYAYRALSGEIRDVFPQVHISMLKKLPIRRIDFSNVTDKDMHDALVALVERMLELQRRIQPLRGTGLSDEHDLLREVERVDAEIDNLVYDLYGLTEAERSLVEGG